MRPLTDYNAHTVHVTVIPNDKGNPPGTLAAAEVYVVGDSLFAGLTLIGLSIWERRGGARCPIRSTFACHGLHRIGKTIHI